MIDAAGSRLAPVVRRTPLLRSPRLDAIAGRRVFVKAECLQHTGSFKFRGGWSALSGMPAGERKRGVLAYSSGNHAQGLALAARMHGVPAVIVMPTDTPGLKLSNTAACGAEIVRYDRVAESREALGERICRDRGLTLVRPYDEPLVIAGQASVGLELAQQATDEGLERADVLVPCGGGGLTAGIALALAERAPGLRPRTCEPAGFDDAARSLEAGERLANPAMSGSICDAIVTPMPGAVTFPVLRAHCGPGLVVTDAQCLHAMALAMVHLKVVLEPGGAVALASALFHPRSIDGDDVIVVASGGNADPEILRGALAETAIT